ncbi:MAG: 16S rRNA (uracil(1498)-N(3))-methyltransferase [Bacilli bacterium]|nr:16S rRNA (uracil(1498)-N(3))-methyltransferase [Bacilli bacterium]
MQRYFSEEKINNQLVLNEDDIYHIKTVMRMKDNDEIIVVYKKIAYLCCLENVKENIKINIKKELEKVNYNTPIVNLIIPILKEQKMDLILQKATELGISSITPIITNRSIIKLKPSDYDKKMTRWKKIVKEASEQSHRIDIPDILDIKEIKDLDKIDGNKYVCSTREKSKNIKLVMKNVEICDRINVVIGPEGGLTEKEEEMLNKQGFLSITLGNRILRVETVPLFILSVINYEFME